MQRYIRNDSTLSGKLKEELVMMDIDKGMYFSLNPVATYIWEQLEEAHTLDGLVALLVNEYEVDAEECRADVQEHLQEMEKLGLIHQINE